MGVGVEIRKLERDELWRVGEIDRTERLDVLFEQRGTQLVARTGNWDAPAWYADGQGEHSVASQVRAVEHYVDAGGVALGAFAGERWLASALSSRTSDQGSRSSPSFTSARRCVRRASVAVCRTNTTRSPRNDFVAEPGTVSDQRPTRIGANSDPLHAEHKDAHDTWLRSADEQSTDQPLREMTARDRVSSRSPTDDQ